MPTFVPLKTDTPWSRLRVTKADWKNERPEVLARLLEQLFLIRRFEEKLLDLGKEGLVHGPVHTSIGQEGAAVGSISVLETEDKIAGTHRMHHQFLAKALGNVTPADYDPRRDPVAEPMRQTVRRTMAEIMGLTPGYGGGRGGSMHLRLAEAGVLGASAIVGGNLPQAVGYAMAEKIRGDGNLSVAFFGDGALQNGAAYESMNMAALYDLPVVFFLENNLYAVSTHISEQTRETRLSARGLGLAIPSIEIDGMDPMAARKAMQWARRTITEDRGPVFIVAEVYRYLHQSGELPGSAFGYRDKDEEKAWRQRDPVSRLPRKLAELGVLDGEEAEAMDRRAREVVDAAAAALTETEPEGNARRVIPALWPDPKSVENGIRGDLGEFKGVPVREVEDFDPARMEEIKYLDAVSRVMLRNMERSKQVIVLGEDVHRLGGGTAGATKGIGERFPERLIGTPISENGFIGLALGAALNGLRPVVEIMYPDFCLVAADQLFNHVGKVRHMFGGDFPVPVVVRSRVSAYIGYGSQHSMDPSGLFAQFPGWRIVAPSTPFDYIGLMNAAILCDDPVLVVEHNQLYPTVGPVPTGDMDYVIPLGSAKVVRPGAACTVLTYSAMVPVSIQAADESGIDSEVIDLRTLDPLGLDWPTIEASVKRTNRVMVVEQTGRGHALGARIVQEVQERCFDWLDHQILHVTGTNAPPVVSKVLEAAALADHDAVIAGLRSLVDN